MRLMKPKFIKAFAQMVSIRRLKLKSDDKIIPIKSLMAHIIFIS